MRPRFYCPDARAGDVSPLPPDEAQHLTRVLRLTPGAPIVVFDGAGHEFDAIVETVGKRGGTVRVGAARDASAPEPRVAVTLAQAVLKGDKMDEVVRDAAMMGVTAIQPIVATRSEVSLAALERGRRVERWRKIAVSSAKQSGRAVVPLVAAPVAIDQFSPANGLMLVEPGARGGVPLTSLNGPAPDRATLVVGPEGGWTGEEIRAVPGDCRLVTLGGRTLRADATAIIALAACYTLWKEF